MARLTAIPSYPSIVLSLFVALAGLLLPGGVCRAGSVGLTTLPALKMSQSGVPSGPITIWYPSAAPETTLTTGPFVLKAAWGGAPVRGNGALIALSHGSGGSATTYHDLARVLAEAGFVVISPEHDGDNWQDQRKTGPDSWKQRPAEISLAVDRVQSDPAFAPLLDKQRIGVFGMSAGGLTALTFSGASWSLDRLIKHCADHFEEDLRFCAFREVAAAGAGQLDEKTRARVKDQYAQGVRSGMIDATKYAYQDKRVKAVVAAVPVGSVIDPASLQTPTVPTALISAELDSILAPRWHVLAIQNACKSCVPLAVLKQGGHLSILSPLPDAVVREMGAWAKDPPGFDRAALPPLYRTIAQFFLSHV